MKQVSEFMNVSPQYCSRSEGIQALANRMFRSNIGFLPVVDENNNVIGTITDRDVALAIGRTNQPLEKLKAGDIMNTGAHTILPEDDVDRALEIMRTQQVGRLPVVDKEKKLRGVVSLLGIARRIKGNGEKELEHEGKENIIHTLHAIAERNHNPENLEEYLEE